MADWYLKKGDSEEPMVFDLSDSAGLVELGAPGTEVQFQMRQAGSGETKVDAAAVVDPDQTNHRGRVRYYWDLEDVDTAGTFWGEFKVTFPDGKIATFPNGEAYIEIEIGAGVDDLS